MSTPTRPKHKRARVLQLYCPDIDATVENFMITPSETHADILKHIKARFDGEKLEEVSPCDVNGEPLLEVEDEISNFDRVEHGERILVGSECNKRVRPEPELKVVLYLEDDTLPKALRKMSREARRTHIRTLRRRDAIHRENILRLNLPHSDITTALQELDTATEQQMKSKYSVVSSKRIIKENWQVKMVHKGSQKCLAALAILSTATCGQPLVPDDTLRDACAARRTNESEPLGLQEVDVRAVIEGFYKAANAIGSKWPDNQVNKAIAGRDKKKVRFAIAKSKERSNERDAAAVERLGEEANEAAHPRTKVTKEVDDLVGRLGKAAVPDKEVIESVSDEEEDEEYQVWRPGRFKRARQ